MTKSIETSKVSDETIKEAKITSKELDKLIGRQLKKKRREAKISQTELGTALNLSQVVVHKFEDGSQKIAIDVLYAIAHCLNISIADLLPANDWDVEVIKKTRGERIDSPENALFDKILRMLGLRNDFELSVCLEVAPPVISKIIHGTLDIGNSLLLRIHEKTEIPIKEMRGYISKK